ncbi:enoyl-CoA delta isomerase 2-like isoform X2 [Daphnia pulex]|uniref:enoyl-CoA delta isomerase 2-like isoform X2 n=1 Tax=Daphnia pulex TaxID=6669 RepID=UPI001EDE54A8|nr:enoyl-CoA delta isomerase 2-like isoform X2 [Daphnia pulex]
MIVPSIAHCLRNRCLSFSLMKPMACIGTPRLVSVIGTHRFSTSINQQFDEAQKRLQTLKASPGNEAKLKLYGLFKQATVGKVNTKRPGMTDFVGKAKWDAWNSLNSLSQVEAKDKYIEFVNSLVGPENSAESSAAPKSAAAGFEVSMDGKLRIIRINKPEKKNPFTLKMYLDFAQLLKDAAEDQNTTLVAVTGTGDYFSSGNDLTNFTSFSGSVSEAAEEGKRNLKIFVNSLVDFPKPIIGVVNGPALGIACTILGLMDAVYATDRGWFQTPFSALGQSPEACSSYTFPKLMGSLKANEMLLFNKKITAVEACKLGLVTQVFQDANFQSEVWPKIKEWSELPINSLVYSKQLSRQFDTEILHKVNDAECERLLERWQSEDCMEAIMKFFSKNSK